MKRSQKHGEELEEEISKRSIKYKFDVRCFVPSSRLIKFTELVRQKLKGNLGTFHSTRREPSNLCLTKTVRADPIRVLPKRKVYSLFCYLICVFFFWIFLSVYIITREQRRPPKFDIGIITGVHRNLIIIYYILVVNQVQNPPEVIDKGCTQTH